MTKRDYINRIEMYEKLNSQLNSIRKKTNDLSIERVYNLLIYKILWYKEILRSWNTQTGTHTGYYGTTRITTSTTSRFISSKSN